MSEKEAKELIKNYVLENFDDRWHTEPLYFEEYHDFFQFSINSKKYFESRDFHHLFVGLGSSFLSKKFGNIVQYGSGSRFQHNLRDFLITEYRLNIVRTKYEIEYPDYNYQYYLEIKDITNIDKASKYVNDIFHHRGSQNIKEIYKDNILELTSVDYFSLLNLMYFNVIDPFCECSYKKLITKFGSPNPLSSFESISQIESSDRMFYKHMVDRVNHIYPLFEINKNYTVSINEIFDTNKFNQYFITASFKHYGENEIIGYIGYIDYTDDEIAKIMEMEKKIFDFIEGDELLFFLFANTLESFCKIEIEIMSDNLNIR